MRIFGAGFLALFLALAVMAPVADAATQSAKQDVLVLKKKKLAAAEMRRKAALRAALDRRRAAVSRQQARQSTECRGSFLKCLFGKPRNGTRMARSRMSSDYATAQTVSWKEGTYAAGSIDGHGGIHKGFTPACLSKTSAMCPPSSRTVTRRSRFSIAAARRPRKVVEAAMVGHDLTTEREKGKGKRDGACYTVSSRRTCTRKAVRDGTTRNCSCSIDRRFNTP